MMPCPSDGFLPLRRSEEALLYVMDSRLDRVLAELVPARAPVSLSFNMSLIFISLGGEEQLSVKGLKIMLSGRKW